MHLLHANGTSQKKKKIPKGFFDKTVKSNKYLKLWCWNTWLAMATEFWVDTSKSKAVNLVNFFFLQQLPFYWQVIQYCRLLLTKESFYNWDTIVLEKCKQMMENLSFIFIILSHSLIICTKKSVRSWGVKR